MSDMRRLHRPGNAAVFFDRLDIHPVDCSAALEAADPLCANPPLPPSCSDEKWAFVAPYLMSLPQGLGQQRYSLRAVCNGLR